MTQNIAALIQTGFVEKKEDYSFDSQRVFDIELFRAAYDCLTSYLARPCRSFQVSTILRLSLNIWDSRSAFVRNRGLVEAYKSHHFSTLSFFSRIIRNRLKSNRGFNRPQL